MGPAAGPSGVHRSTPWRRPGRVTLEDGKRLSDSLLWSVQRRYFEEQGIAAWSEGHVPFYVTANAYIAAAYARVALGFLRDACRSENSGTTGSPRRSVHIVELGAGHGRFSYQFLTGFLRLLRTSPLADLPVTHVMTDFIPATLDAWEQHPYLRRLVDKGVLDFAVFDASDPQPLELRHAGRVLDGPEGPVILIANYVFDSISADCFTIEGGELYEKVASVSAPAGLPLAGAGVLEKLEISYRHRPVGKDAYYRDPELERILRLYGSTLPDGDFLFPVAPLGCLRFFADMARGGLLLMSSDKGYARPEELGGMREPQIVRHGGCFSLMVNFDAIARYVEGRAGLAFRLPHGASHLQFAAYALGLGPPRPVETSLALAETMERFAPDDFFTLKGAIDSHCVSLGAAELLAYLRLSEWDPECFLACYPRLLDAIAGATEAMRRGLLRAALAVWDRYYPMGESSDVPYCLGVLMTRLSYFPEAIRFFEASLDLHGPDPRTLVQLATCHYALHRLGPALAFAKEALALDPHAEQAKTMQMTIAAEMAERSGAVEHSGATGEPGGRRVRP